MTPGADYVIYNGQLQTAAGFSLPHSSRAALYGDGFFETMVWTAGRVGYLAGHLARLQQAAAVLRLELPPELQSAEAIAAEASRLVAATSREQARLRLQCWRGGAGLYLPETNRADYLLAAADLHLNDKPINEAGFARQVQTLPGPLAFCKGPQGWLYVLAAQERQARGLGELLLLDAHGAVAEAVAAAVFWIQDGALYTPALTTGCVAGVRRAHLLQVARERGIECHEGHFSAAQVLASEAVFTANVAGLRAVQRIEQSLFESEDHALLQDLRVWEQVA
ncbi:aminotransferase class IV [Hymenobacter koreensis]|uniref:branched-chain-amino-acid transaminase n=1 Tax=Hymenobacter koreensis TaxID=1084523 RepID=A0ABP8J6Q8_9BACT